jgi:hypothetical protein
VDARLGERRDVLACGTMEAEPEIVIRGAEAARVERAAGKKDSWRDGERVVRGALETNASAGERVRCLAVKVVRRFEAAQRRTFARKGGHSLE